MIGLCYRNQIECMGFKKSLLGGTFYVLDVFFFLRVGQLRRTDVGGIYGFEKVAIFLLFSQLIQYASKTASLRILS